VFVYHHLPVHFPAQTAGIVDITVSVSGITSSTSAADQFTYDQTVAVTGIAPSAGRSLEPRR